MPQIFTIDGLMFFFFSREHLPIHVHVLYGDAQLKIQMEPNIEVIENLRMKPKQVKKAMEIAENRKTEIIAKWHEHFRK